MRDTPTVWLGALSAFALVLAIITGGACSGASSQVEITPPEFDGAEARVDPSPDGGIVMQARVYGSWMILEFELAAQVYAGGSNDGVDAALGVSVPALLKGQALLVLIHWRKNDPVIACFTAGPFEYCTDPIPVTVGPGVTDNRPPSAHEGVEL